MNKIPELILAKVFCVGDYKKDNYGSSAWNMFLDIGDFVDGASDGEKYVGIIYYRNGKIDTMGNVNFLAGECDDCTINKDEVGSVVIYKVTL